MATIARALGPTSVAATSGVNVKAYGALGTNHATADKIGIDAAIAAAIATGSREILFPAGTYRYDGVLQINTRGLRFVGERHGRPTDTGGTRINFYTAAASSAGIQIGTDDGQPYGNADYGGVQGFTIEDMSLAAVSNGAGNTALANGAGTYVPGSFGVKDWKGGDVRLSRVTFEHFAEGFWGVNSDLNRFEDTEFFYNKKAIFLGPRSDQFVSRSSYLFFNDQDIHIDGARVVTFYDYVSNSSGAGTVCPVTITGAYSQAADGVTFFAPWLEHSANPGTIDAWFDIGPSDSDTQIGEVVIIDPWWLSNRSTDSPVYHEKYLAKLGNAKTLTVRNPMGTAGPANVDALVAFVGATSPHCHLEASATWWQYLSISTNLGSGTPRLHTRMTTGLSASNQGIEHQMVSNLLIQKTDAAIGSGASILEVHRNLSGARALVINNSGNVIPQAGFSVNGRSLSGPVINGIGSYTATWNPGTVTNASTASTTVTCSGAVVGDPVLVGFSQAVVAGVLITAAITASGTATVTVHNVSGSSWTPGSGTVRVDVIGH